MVYAVGVELAWWERGGEGRFGGCRLLEEFWFVLR